MSVFLSFSPATVQALDFSTSGNTSDIHYWRKEVFMYV